MSQQCHRLFDASTRDYHTPTNTSYDEWRPKRFTLGIYFALLNSFLQLDNVYTNYDNDNRQQHIMTSQDEDDEYY